MAGEVVYGPSPQCRMCRDHQTGPSSSLPDLPPLHSIVSFSLLQDGVFNKTLTHQVYGH